MDVSDNREEFKIEFTNLLTDIIQPAMNKLMDDFNAWGYKAENIEPCDSCLSGKCYKVYTKNAQSHIKITVNPDEEEFKTLISTECSSCDRTIKNDALYKSDEITSMLLEKIVIDCFSKIVQ